MIKFCLECENGFKTSHKKTKFCSKKCYLIDRIKKHIIPKSAFKKGFHPLTEWRKGCPAPPTAFKKGNNSWNKGKFGFNSHTWKGGKINNGSGYILVYKPKHPFVNASGYVAEHRLVMEQMLGRYLTPEEVIHHKGTKYPMGSFEDRGDNRPNNLELFANNSKHQKFHKNPFSN